MAETYRLSAGRRAFNWVMEQCLKIGFGPQSTYLLTVEGRKTGRPHSTPVSLIEEGRGQRWLVSPYGEVNWVKNARVAGDVTLSKGRDREVLKAVELQPEDAAPILRTYLDQHRIVRPFFDVTTQSPINAFIAEAPSHPVFRLDRTG